MVYIYTLTLYYLWMVNNAGLNVSMVCLILNFFLAIAPFISCLITEAWRKGQTRPSSRFEHLIFVPWELGVSTHIFGLYPNQITASGSSRPFPAPNRKHLSLCDIHFCQRPNICSIRWQCDPKMLLQFSVTPFGKNTACNVILYQVGTRICAYGLPQCLQLHANECFSVII